MSRLRVQCFSISIDGYGAGPRQNLQNPIGVGGLAMMDWFRPTKMSQEMTGGSGGTTGIHDQLARRGFANVGAWILGRNMFGPIRGAWTDEAWKGRWGPNPPYHAPTSSAQRRWRKTHESENCSCRAPLPAVHRERYRPDFDRRAFSRR